MKTRDSSNTGFELGSTYGGAQCYAVLWIRNRSDPDPVGLVGSGTTNLRPESTF
jgi:hypothetical protein